MAIWDDLKKIVDKIVGETMHEPDPAPSIPEFILQWHFVYMKFVAWVKWPDERDEYVGPVGTEPRDTFDSGGTLEQAFNAYWN